jgi:hypothetical protein
MLTEKTIDQILGVLELTANKYQSGLPVPKAYQKSVKEIAHKYSIRYQTIADGCRRRLGLGNVNQFIELLKDWLGGGSEKLKDLLIKNAGGPEEYKIKMFFAKEFPPSIQHIVERNVDDKVDVISFKIAQNIAFQFRSLAEAEGKSVQDLAMSVIKEYVDINYVEYLKNIINSLPQSDKEKVLAELTKMSNSKQ